MLLLVGGAMALAACNLLAKAPDLHGEWRGTVEMAPGLDATGEALKGCCKTRRWAYTGTT